MFPLAAAALLAGVSGVVFDPQDLTVRGARVELQCGDRIEATHTDGQGRFAVTAALEDRCILSITHEGFAPFRQHPILSGAPMVIRLQVAVLQQRVDVVAAKPPPTRLTFGSVTLSADDHNLRTFAGTTADLIRYAQVLAGTSARPASIYVDGLPAGALPPIDAIAHISINGDPFSAEYADADVSSIEIITKAPSRLLRFFMGGDTPGIDGRDVLAPALRKTSRFINAGVRGPVPHLPLTFSASGNVSRASQETPIQIRLPELGEDANASETANRNESGSVSLHYAPTSSLQGRVSFRESRARGLNVGVGGVTVQDAGFASSYMTRESRVTTTKISSRFLYETGAVVGWVESHTRANATTPGITVGGDAVMGGAPISESRRNTTRWNARQVVRSRSSRPWTLGIVAFGTDEANRHTPNHAGTFHFPDVDAYREAMAGGQTGSWYVTRGEELVQFNNRAAAVFAQSEFLRTEQFAVSGGVRADYQSGFGVLVSPRMSLATAWRGVGLRAGVGMFVHRVPDSIFINAIENDGQHLQQFVATDVSLLEAAESRLRSASSVQSRIDTGLTRPRALQWQLSVERPVGSLTPAVEYAFTGDRRLIGSDRRQSEAGWIDVFESNRSAMRQRLHAYGRYAWKQKLVRSVAEGQFVADYEFTRARDNTDGPFSFPEQPGNLAAEWARSAGMSPHTLTMMTMFILPAAISLNVVHNWRSGAPFNITTARDTGGNGLVLDRGGRPRNSGDGPRFHSMSLYAHRRIAWPDVLKAPRGAGINVSVQADNILNNRNYLAIGSIAGSKTFGEPLAAYPGRSVRVLLSVD